MVLFGSGFGSRILPVNVRVPRMLRTARIRGTNSILFSARMDAARLPTASWEGVARAICLSGLVHHQLEPDPDWGLVHLSQMQQGAGILAELL